MKRVINYFREMKVPFSWRRISIAVGIVILLCLIFSAGAFAYTYSYNDKVLPGTKIAGVEIGGMNRADLEKYLQGMDEKIANAGLKIIVDTDAGEKNFIIYPLTVGADSAEELWSIDAEVEADLILNNGKDSDWSTRIENTLSGVIYGRHLVLGSIKINKEKLLAAIIDRVGKYEKKPREANIKVTAVNPLNYEIVTAASGYVFSYEDAVSDAAMALANLQAPEIKLLKENSKSSLTTDEAKSVAAKLPAVIAKGGLSLVYHDPFAQKDLHWEIPVAELATWLNIQKIDQNLAIGLDKDLAEKYLQAKIAPSIKVESQNAKFKVDNGKVAELQGSKPGIDLDVDETYALLNSAITDRTFHEEGLVSVLTPVIKKVEPILTLATTNDMGIADVLGIGTSDFSGSSSNRIKNIANAVKKLNGVLIAPGEEFSTIKFTRPFTLDGGYFPEAVIKGDSIEKDIGGGLCQIGTTLFRMAMNSGMKITERHNHSLVVHYYGDVTNGQPGTDATVFDPQPDLRFVNDTGSYVLIQTEMDKSKNKLYFSLWGKDDGRKGSYSPPIVKRWIPYGEQKNTETSNLPMGETKCQNAFKGASTSFTYTRVLSDGTKEDQVFDSYYRPLPKICLIGTGVVDGVTSTVSGVSATPAPAVPSTN